MRLGSGTDTAVVNEVPLVSRGLPGRTVKANATVSSSKSLMSILLIIWQNNECGGQVLVLRSEHDKKFEEQVNGSPGSTSSSTTKNVLVGRPIYSKLV